uniref:Uncharacterized protein n=1 Tax=viral metagenome TaxID=1070528 RepID=A0A6C0DF19_9ZZZZ
MFLSAIIMAFLAAMQSFVAAMQRITILPSNPWF